VTKKTYYMKQEMSDKIQKWVAKKRNE